MVSSKISIETCISVLIFCCKLMLKSEKLKTNPLTFLDLLGRTYRKATTLSPKLSAYKKVQKGSSKSFRSNGSFDPNSFILVNPFHLILLRIRSGSWCLVQCCVQSSLQSTKLSHHWVRLISNERTGVGQCCLSPVLYSNIAQRGMLMSLTIETDYFPSAYKHEYFLSIQTSKVKFSVKRSPCNAATVSLSVIEHHSYKSSSNLDDALNEYFENPKLVAKGNVISVPIQQPLLVQDIASESETAFPVFAYFYVNDVKCASKSCSVMLGHTASSRTTQFYITANCQESVCLPLLDSVIAEDGSISVPPHVSDSYQKVKKIVHSQLCSANAADEASAKQESHQDGHFRCVISNHESKVNQSASSHESASSKRDVGHVLIQGSATDVGILLEYFRGGLGLSVYLYECWKLKGDTSSATEAKIQKVLQAHLSSTASVIILSGVDYLLQSSSGDGGEDGRVCLALSRSLEALARSNSLVIAAVLRDLEQDSCISVSDGLWRMFRFQEVLSSKVDTSVREKLILWFLKHKYSRYVSPSQSLNLGSDLRSNSSQLQSVCRPELGNHAGMVPCSELQPALCGSINADTSPDEESESADSNHSTLLSDNVQISTVCRYEQSPKFTGEDLDVEALVSLLTQRTAGLGYAAIDILLSSACELASEELDQDVDAGGYMDLRHHVTDPSSSTPAVSDVMPCHDNLRAAPSLRERHVLAALDDMSSRRRAGFVKGGGVPTVLWGDVGALEEPKRELVNTINIPLLYPHLVVGGVRRAGVLLYGPPGTGKTLLAKAVASECRLSFLSVKGPELLNMYVGESERNVRKIFSEAQSCAPCVIFFDELDALTPNRGAAGDSGGVMDRVVSAVVAELDECSRRTTDAPVFVLGATNRPDLIDPALLRPGRFDKLVYLGPCTDRASLLKILRAVTSKLPLSPDVSLDHVVSQLPARLTGADLKAVASDAFYAALREAVHSIESGTTDAATARVVVSESHLLSAASAVSPSVSSDQLKQYEDYNTQMRVVS